MKIIILFFGLLFFAQNIFGQCSDAGVCSLGNLKTDSHSSKRQQIGLDYIFAYSGKEDKISYHTIQLSAAIKLLENSTINFKVPLFAVQDGPLGSVSGIGDLIFSFNQNIYADPQSNLYIQLGSKLATGDANKNGSLPMAYQTGLGTNDFLFGILYTQNEWSFSAGYQLAENMRNTNALTKIKRGDDVYLKAAYNFEFNEYSLVPEILIIKRLQKSSTIMAGTSQKVSEKNSDPLQINVGSRFSYSVNEAISLNIRTALALLKRKKNVDGLTRGITLGIGSVFYF